MTHKPKINKYLWLSAGKSWRFTTSTRHKLVVLFVFALCILPANLCGQSLAIKSNLLYDLTTSLNLGGEIRCDDTHTFSLSVNYNPWNFSGNKKMKHFLVQPEYRKWLNEAFTGGFIGLQVHYALYNFGGMLPWGFGNGKMLGIENRQIANNRYQGNLLPAQNVKLDIKPHFLGVRADSLFVSMDISVEIEDMNPKNAVILTPILTGQDRKILLPAIQLNGKQKQKLYVRNQILRKKKNSKESNTAYLVTGIDDENSRTIAYQTSLPAEQWMNDAALYLRRTIVRPESEQTLKDTLILAPQYAVLPPNVTATDIPAQEISATTMSTNSMPSISPTPVNKKLKYKGSYISPASDDVDIRNQKELNFNLEEAKIMADINPQMLSLRELYTVALSYADNKTKFYQIINISVKLYPVHPVANLNAAAAAIEQGDTKSASKFLSMALHEGLAYKSCRGVYELMTGNTYEGIRILKAAKAEGSEEAAYNLNVFFENNKRP